MPMFINKPEIDTSLVWQCCGSVSSEEDPSYYTLWKGTEYQGRIIDPLCEDLPAHIVLCGSDEGSDKPPAFPGRIETQQLSVSHRLQTILRTLPIQVQVRPDCIDADTAREHACRLWSTVMPAQALRHLPPAMMSRAASALAALMETPAATTLSGPIEFTIENLADSTLLLTIQAEAGRIDIRPLVPSRKLDAIRLRTRRYTMLGTEWDWLLAHARKGPLQREQVDVLCGMAEVLLSLVKEGVPREPRSLLLGNWLRMPRQVRVLPRAA